MAFDLTQSTRRVLQKVNLEPQLVLEIDGVATRYGVRVISKRVKIGDADLLIDGTWKIGGLKDLENQADYISLTDGTSTSIRYQLNPDKGIGVGISNMQVALVDIDQDVSKLVSPGVVVNDVLGRKARIYLGFADVAFPEDYVTIFRGIIDDIQAKPGVINLSISHPDQKKRQQLFPKTTSTLNGTITAGAGVLMTNDSDPWFLMDTTATGGDGLLTYIKIDDEWMRLTFRVDSQTWYVTRGQLGTTGAVHNDGAEITAMYSLKGNVIDLALWLMLSTEDSNDPYVEVDLTSVNYVNIDESYFNAFYFQGVDLVEKHGVTVGDIVTNLSGVGGNYINATYGVTVSEIIQRVDGTVIVIEGHAFNLTTEAASTTQIGFISKYNVMTTGLGLTPNEVDIAEFERIKRLFLPSFNVEVYTEENENAKDLIDQHLLGIAGAYSLPRKGKVSAGMHIGPIPGTKTSILSKNDIKNASEIRVRRGLANNFYNTIIYKYDKEVDSSDYASALVTQSATSLTRVKVGTRALVVEARGLRTSLSGQTQAAQASNRRLNRYQFGAEYIENLKLTFAVGFNIEIGDIVLLDATDLNILNSASGNRNPAPKLYEVVNKSIDLRTGDIAISLVDTNFSTQNRYGLISPSSKIKSGLSTTQFIIEPSYNTTVHGSNEGQKWSRYLETGGTVAIKVKSPNGTTRFGQSTIQSVLGNTITLATALGFTPQAGDLLELADYDYTGVTDTVKTLYAHMRDSAFGDSKTQYKMI